MCCFLFVVKKFHIFTDYLATAKLFVNFAATINDVYVKAGNCEGNERKDVKTISLRTKRNIPY